MTNEINLYSVDHGGRACSSIGTVEEKSCFFLHHFNRLNYIERSSSRNSICMVKIFFHMLDEKYWFSLNGITRNLYMKRIGQLFNRCQKCSSATERTTEIAKTVTSWEKRVVQRWNENQQEKKLIIFTSKNVLERCSLCYFLQSFSVKDVEEREIKSKEVCYIAFIYTI